MYLLVQASVSKESPIPVSRVTWSSDGNYLGMDNNELGVYNYFIVDINLLRK